MSAENFYGDGAFSFGVKNDRGGNHIKKQKDAIVLEIVDRSMRSHEGNRVATTSPTARDNTRLARKQMLANLKKYR